THRLESYLARAGSAPKLARHYGLGRGSSSGTRLLPRLCARRDLGLLLGDPRARFAGKRAEAPREKQAGDWREDRQLRPANQGCELLGADPGPRSGWREAEDLLQGERRPVPEAQPE